jgi:hypothetical protein
MSKLEIKLKMIRDRIMIVRTPPVVIKASNILGVDGKQGANDEAESHARGLVLDVGPDVKEVKKNDVVLISPGVGDPFDLFGIDDEVEFIFESDVHAIMHKGVKVGELESVVDNAPVAEA